MSKPLYLAGYLLQSPIMRDAEEKRRYRPLVRALSKERLQIPPEWQHSYHYARFCDERRAREGSPKFDKWVKEQRNLRYAGLSPDECDEVEECFQAPSACVVTNDNYPRLIKLFQEMCDTLHLKRFGPHHNKYPRLILAQSDCSNALSVPCFEQLPFVVLSTADFSIHSSRMVASSIAHELWHLKSECIPDRIRKVAARKPLLTKDENKEKKWRAAVLEEYDADNAAKLFGISGDELAEAKLEELHWDQRKKVFGDKIKAIMQDLEIDNTQSLPEFFQMLAGCEYETPRKESYAERRRNDMESKHPHPKYRIMNVLRDNVKTDPLWVNRLNGNFNKGTLLDM